jgi:hypothetical protein
MKNVIRFLKFWYDFLIGDAWEIAAGVVAALAIAAILVGVQPALSVVLGLFLGGAIAVVLGVSVWRGWQERRPRAARERRE